MPKNQRALSPDGYAGGGGIATLDPLVSSLIAGPGFNQAPIGSTP
jgi:hypothetical protein